MWHHYRGADKSLARTGRKVYRCGITTAMLICPNLEQEGKFTDVHLLQGADKSLARPGGKGYRCGNTTGVLISS